MDIFIDDVDRRCFLNLLGSVVEEYGVTCWTFCLMSTHYHFSLNPTRPNISKAMQRLNSEYAQWFNKRHGRVGHVLQGRFKDQIVQKEGYLYTLCRYIVMNPVRAGLVNDPAEWPWSSYRATVGLAACPAFLSSRSVLNLFGDGELETLQTRFVKYVNEPHPEEENIIDRFRSKEVIIGDAAFKACVRAEAGWDDDARAVETAETALALSDASALSG